MAHAATSVFQVSDDTKRRYFKRHLDSLALMKSRFAESRSSADNGVIRPLHVMCVGLDYCGHELHYPHCSFALADFTRFVFRERSKRHDHFGFRISTGDLLHLHNMDSELMVVHMGVMATAILCILDKYEEWWRSFDGNYLKELPTKCPPPLRIGHGTALLEFVQIDLTNLPLRSAGPPLVAFRTAILHLLKKISELRIPVEVIPSHTLPLSHRGMDLNPVYKFVKKGFCVVVCSTTIPLQWS